MESHAEDCTFPARGLPDSIDGLFMGICHVVSFCSDVLNRTSCVAYVIHRFAAPSLANPAPLYPLTLSSISHEWTRAPSSSENSVRVSVLSMNGCVTTHPALNAVIVVR